RGAPGQHGQLRPVQGVRCPGGCGHGRLRRREGGSPVTAREDFERAVSGMLEFACCEVSDEELAAVLAAADEYRAEGLRAFAAELDEMARTYRKHPQVT